MLLIHVRALCVMVEQPGANKTNRILCPEGHILMSVSLEMVSEDHIL